MSEAARAQNIIDEAEAVEASELGGEVVPEMMDARLTRREGRWIPRKWRPEYEAIVALSCTGVSNKYLAAKFDKSEVHISQILATPQAAVVRKIISQQFRREVLTEMGLRIERIQSAALEVVEDVLINQREEILKSKGGVAFLFEKSLTALQAIGKIGGSEDTKTVNNITNNIVNNQQINMTLQQQLVDGMDKANKALELHGDLEVRKRIAAIVDGDEKKD